MRNIDKSLLRKLIQNMIDYDRDEWPPNSPGAYYQPVRPKKDAQNKDDDKSD